VVLALYYNLYSKYWAYYTSYYIYFKRVIWRRCQVLLLPCVRHRWTSMKEMCNYIRRKTYHNATLGPRNSAANDLALNTGLCDNRPAADRKTPQFFTQLVSSVCARVITTVESFSATCRPAPSSHQSINEQWTQQTLAVLAKSRELWNRNARSYDGVRGDISHTPYDTVKMNA